MTFRSFIDRYGLIIAMMVGAVGYPCFRHFSGLLSPLIFLMLFFTFCKINPLHLRLRTWHWIVLGVQMLLTIGIYYGVMAIASSPSHLSPLTSSLSPLTSNLSPLTSNLSPLTSNPIAIIAQGLMMCVIMPTATAAPIIAGKLGGSIQNLTTFSLLSNIVTAIIVPLFFPLIVDYQMDILPSIWLILRRVAPLLLGPFLSAWALRLVYEAYHRRQGNPRSFSLNRTWAAMPFYLWLVLLIVLTSRITHTLLTQDYSGGTIIILCVGALVTCLLQFVLGRWIGYHFPAASHGADYQDILINPEAAHYTINQKSRITAGQAFGQKNTALGVWMAQIFLHPLAAIGPAAYIIWQNLLNSYQLWKAGTNKKPYQANKQQ